MNRSRMGSWKSALLNAYYLPTLPWRNALFNSLAARAQSPAMVLFYHRVADSHPNGWTISRKEFAQHLDWVSAKFEWASLAEIVGLLRGGTMQQPKVHITFDDGYAENMEFAIPLLAERKIPFTYFVCTEHVFRHRPFDHDVRRGAPLEPNSPDDLLRIVEAGGEIGSHTRNHLDLGQVACERELEDEILGSRHVLEKHLGQPVRFFAFPYGQFGNLNAAAFRLARRAGYEACCSAYGGYNFPGEDAFHIQRIHGDPDLTFVKNWLTLDPRKVNSGKHFEYEESSP